MAKVLIVVKDSPYPIETGSHKRVITLTHHLKKKHTIDILMPQYTYRNNRFLNIKEIQYLMQLYDNVHFFEDKLGLVKKILKKIFKYSKYFTFSNIENKYNSIKRNYDYIILSEIYFLPMLKENHSSKIILDAMVPYYLQSKDIIKSNLFIEQIRSYEKHMIKKVDYIMCISDDVLDYYSQYSENVFLTKIPVDIELTSSTLLYDFIFIGVNNEININALTFFKEKIMTKLDSNFKFVLLGSIADSDFVKTNFKGNQFTLLPHVQNKKEYFSRSLFSVSLIFQGYGLQTKVLEGLSFGSINIISKKSNASFQLKNLVNAIVYDDNINKLIIDINKVMNNQELQKEIRNNACIYTKENFNEDTIYLRLDNIIH